MNRPVAGRRMSGVTLGAACLLSLALASNVLAAQYPPGPENCCPDTLTIINLQNPLATPHPTTGDVVLGVGGVITGFADQFHPYGFYMQMRNGHPYSGIAVFTGGVNHGPGTSFGLQLGDSVVVYGKVKSYKGAVAIGSIGGNDEILGATPDSPNSNEDLLVRVVSRGNPLPPFHVGSLAELEKSISNLAARPWDGMLVRLNGPLEVVRLLDESANISSTGDLNHSADRSFLVVDPACTGAVCDTVMVDCSTLTNYTPPPLGTLLTFVQGCFDLREARHRIQMRGPGDIGLGNAPLALDAFPTSDNDLLGALRLDQVMVVFDRPVEQTSAENVANYSLASNGTIDSAHRLDAPNDDRVVLQIRNALNDGDHEAVTVKDVASLADGTPMGAPQTFDFLNGVLELEKVQAPDPALLANNPCEDRSRFSGPGSTPGLRASVTGTVTGRFGDFYTLQGTTLTRGGLWVHSTGFPLTPGHAYVLAGALQDVSGETREVNVVYAIDLGTAPDPVPTLQSVRTLLDDTCDDTQLFLNGVDLDGMLVTMDRVVVAGSQPAGSSFYVALPGSGSVLAAARRGATTASVPGQILVAALGSNFSFAAEAGRIVTITGVLGVVDGSFAVFPRSDSDIHDFGPIPTFSQPLNASKSATASRDPDIVPGTGGELFMAWGRVFNESVHSLSLDNTLNWSRPEPILHQGVQPALAVTPSNKFCALSANPDSLFFKQSTDGGFEIDPLVATVDASPTRYPALTVGGGEHLHAAWERTGTGIFYARSLNGGANFSIPIPIALNSQPYETNSMARICATAGDNVFAFWQYHLPGEPSVNRVLFSRSLDGGSTFSTPRRVRDESNPITSVVKLAILGDAQVGPDGTVYVMGLQADGPNDSVAFLRSTNGGTTFALVGHPTAPALRGICPKSFAVGADGTIHALIGICGTALYYTRSTDGGATWGPAVDVTSASSDAVGEPRGAKIILDATGTPVIVWFSPIGASTEIYSTRLLN
ncbi:MAG: hypothetical protein ABIS67_05140 [Candidatus Eisenbacteria bacterium]